MAKADAKMELQEPVRRHSDFYFSDGSVVLIVEKTAFCIHQSVLSRQSDVFAGMFTLPQPTQFDMIDGCQVVHLQDSVADFVDVMKAIYDSLYFDSLSPDADLSTVIKFISGILRISTKYNMTSLRKKCISIVQNKFPSTLDGCDRVLSSHNTYEPNSMVRIIPLAREANVPAILPWAYYLCTHITTDDLIKDPVLSWRDKALCLAGKDRLWDMQKTITHTFLFEFTRSPQCISACQSRLPPMMGWRDTETLRASPHPLEQYSGMVNLKLCAKCLAHVEAQHRSGRQKVWDSLPSVFGLGSWDDINKDQNC